MTVVSGYLNQAALAEITRSEFVAYERVRQKGTWNMFDPNARLATGLDKDTYAAIMHHYASVMAKWPEVRKRWNAKEMTP